ncbi:MAG TPA: trehalase family glycosidase [Candidatus Saccharimonadales bacterium]
MDYYLKLIEDCETVLRTNDFGKYTVPSREIYPHQWLWDSSFIAIGLATIDIDRAKQEIESIFEGQWSNGMLPHMIFRTKESHNGDREFWASWRNPKSPSIPTSGITQPPIIAEAVIRIGKKLPKSERLLWYKEMLPKLISYHQWIYKERDPSNNGLAIIIHPWESGLDNSPPLIKALKENYTPLWLKILVKIKVVKLMDSFRVDTKFVPENQRPTAADLIVLSTLKRRIKNNSYNVKKILSKKSFAVEDLTFNCILNRANAHIVEIAKFIKYDIDEKLSEKFDKTQKALDLLWDPYKSQYFSRDYFTGNLIKEPSIASLMPLYAGNIEKSRIETIVASLEDRKLYASNFPIPSVPLNSPWFKEAEYWQGPSWINTNWFVIDGLKRSKYLDHYEALKETTLEMVENSGIFEYYNPNNGHGEGIERFSWTAALCLEMIKKG